MARHTLIAEVPDGGMVTLEIFVDDPSQVFEIGRKLFPESRLAAVCHTDEDDDG